MSEYTPHQTDIGATAGAPHSEIAAVLWDLDGTLIDSQPLWIESQRRLVEQFGGTWRHADGLALAGVSMARTAAALQQAGVRLSEAEIVTHLSGEVVAALNRRVEWLPGAFALFREVHSLNIAQGIVTSAPGIVARTVAVLLPPGAVGVIVGAEDVTASKPDPEPYLRAAAALGVAPQDCVAVEDSPSGLASAVAANMAAVGVTGDTPLGVDGPWHVVQTLQHVAVDDLVSIHRKHVSI